MTSERSADPDTCSYCSVSVANEREYRKHLRAAHDPSELGAIDRRRYELYRSAPSVVVERGGSLAGNLGDLHYPIDRDTAIRYAVYAVASSTFVAAALGVGL